MCCRNSCTWATENTRYILKIQRNSELVSFCEYIVVITECAEYILITCLRALVLRLFGAFVTSKQRTILIEFTTVCIKSVYIVALPFVIFDTCKVIIFSYKTNASANVSRRRIRQKF